MLQRKKIHSVAPVSSASTEWELGAAKIIKEIDKTQESSIYGTDLDALETVLTEDASLEDIYNMPAIAKLSEMENQLRMKLSVNVVEVTEAIRTALGSAPAAITSTDYI